MKRSWIEYHAKFIQSPMTYWVHIGRVHGRRIKTIEYEPPHPKPVAGEGYPLFFVELDGMTFQFSSLIEIRTCIETLSKKDLPTARQLFADEDFIYSTHWLSRLPMKVKTWRYREKAVKYLTNALAKFEDEIGGKKRTRQTITRA